MGGSEMIGRMRARLRRATAHAVHLLHRRRRRLFGIVFAAAMLPLLPILYVILINGELSGRGIDTIDIAEPSASPAFTITGVIHRLLPEENAVEVSFTVEVDLAELPEKLRGRDDCATLTRPIQGLQNSLNVVHFVLFNLHPNVEKGKERLPFWFR